LIDRRRSGLCLALLLCVPLLGAAPALPLPSAGAAPPLHFDLTPAQIKDNCAAAIASAKAALDGLPPAGAPTFSNVVLPLENAFADLGDETVAETLLASVSPDRAVRDASTACQNDEGAFGNEVTARPALFAAVKAALASGTAQNEADKKLTTLWLTTLQRSGAGLDAPARKEFVALSDRLQELQNQFAQNLANDKTTVALTKAQAAGLPDDFTATLTKTAGGYTVPVNESTVTLFLENASDPAARKAYYLAYLNRGYPANTKLLDDTLEVRAKLAKLMGYPNWAAYVLADRMAQSPQRVDSFLVALDEKLRPRARADIATMAALKAHDLGTSSAAIDPWDTAYYDNMLNKTKYAVDNHAIAQYFPVEHVLPAVFGIYSKILGVTFAKRQNPNVWVSDVTEWTVTDTATGHYIGDFYIDLFPRDGKYAHVASFPLLSVRQMPDGSLRPPLDAIIGNWPKPAPGKPAVLSHDDVETFFHEFGHDMAEMLSTAPYETLSTGFRQDFIEAPSQMLENWVWDPAILKELSSNVTTGAPLPDDLIAKMRAARYVDYAYHTIGQVVLASVDMKYHTSALPIDTTAVWAQVAHDRGILPLPEGVHPEDGFGHIMGGYDAGYYGYLWSKVYAQDMFTAFEAGGLESPVVGARYRHDILEPAREIEPDDEVKAFLGRPMDPSAFYKEFDQEQ
jgi:thimet oligopeptidase